MVLWFSLKNKSHWNLLKFLFSKKIQYPELGSVCCMVMRKTYLLNPGWNLKLNISLLVIMGGRIHEPIPWCIAGVSDTRVARYWKLLQFDDHSWTPLLMNINKLYRWFFLDFSQDNFYEDFCMGINSCLPLLVPLPTCSSLCQCPGQWLSPGTTVCSIS